MTEMIKLEINKEDLLKLLSNYYTNKLGHKVDVLEKHNIGYVGFYETKEAVVSIYYNDEINICGSKATKVVNISLEDIKEIVKENFTDYDISFICFNKGIESVGFYESKSAYFKGLNVELREKQAKLVRK